jgi:peptide deformylase
MNLPTQLLPPNSPQLLTPTQPVNFNEVNVEEIVNHMLTVMSTQNGIGLAANQIGLPYSIFVVNGDPFACINPRIVDESNEEIVMDEGCLTYPKLYVKVKRPKAIRLRWNTITGDTETKPYTGMTARIIQHEMDHLAGRLYFNRVSKYHRDQAFRQQARALKNMPKPVVQKVDGQALLR